jgi:predicted MPP superfamily phosphohydrolase
MKKNRKRRNIALFIFLCIFCYLSNNWIENTRYTISSEKIEQPVVIVHLSDLHGKQFGKNNRRLINNVRKENPDIIVFTGDLIDADLALTGHAHGGQWRLPIIGGVYAPGQGINPKYYQGMTKANGSIQVISRGLGNSKIPLRLFNRPQVITIFIE